MTSYIYKSGKTLIRIRVGYFESKELDIDQSRTSHISQVQTTLRTTLRTEGSKNISPKSNKAHPNWYPRVNERLKFRQDIW